MTVVAVCQLALEVGDSDGNRQRATRAIEAAAAEGARVVVLPELTNSGYRFSDLAEAQRLAETPDGPTVSGWSELAARLDVVVVGGLCERGEDGRLHDSAVLVDGDGARAVYRKAHLWDREMEWFAAGDEAPPVVQTRHGRIAMLICYDLEFPEWARMCAVDGADLIAVPTNWPPMPVPAGERTFLIAHAQVAAVANHVYVAVADRTGRERGADWMAGSVIVAPDGYPVCGGHPGGPAGRFLADCDLPGTRDKTLSARNDSLLDRRVDLYR